MTAAAVQQPPDRTSARAARRHNPIYTLEMNYQQRAIEHRRSRWWWTLLKTLFWALAWGCVAFAVTLRIGTTLNLFSVTRIPDVLQVPALLLFYVLPALTLPLTLVLFHFGLQTRTLLWASNSVSREKLRGTWELLLLSGVTERQLVLGKWWATVRRALPSYLALAALRVGALAVLLESAARVELQTYPALAISVRPYPSDLSLLAMVAGALVLAGFTLLNLLFTASVGMGAALLSGRGGINLALALVMRFAALAVPIGVIFLANLFASRANFGYPSFGYYLQQMSIIVGFTLGENGVLAAVWLAAVLEQVLERGFDYVRDSYNLVFLVVGIGGVALSGAYYLLVGGLALRFAQARARREAVLPADTRRK